MILTPKNLYIDKLDDIVNKYNNTYYSTTKIKPVDVKLKTNIDYDKEINDEDPKFRIGNIVKLSKFKNHFCKRLSSKLIWRSFVIKKVKSTVLWICY